MYEIEVHRDFCAAHAISMNGRQEESHEHRWQVTAVLSGRRLDDDGLLCDFHVLDERLEAIVGPWRDRDLNRTPPFDRDNPTAERVARHIAETLMPDLPRGVTLSRVSVVEAPGCVATYRPE